MPARMRMSVIGDERKIERTRVAASWTHLLDLHLVEDLLKHFKVVHGLVLGLGVELDLRCARAFATTVIIVAVSVVDREAECERTSSSPCAWARRWDAARPSTGTGWRPCISAKGGACDCGVSVRCVREWMSERTLSARRRTISHLLNFANPKAERRVQPFEQLAAAHEVRAAGLVQHGDASHEGGGVAHPPNPLSLSLSRSLSLSCCSRRPRAPLAVMRRGREKLSSKTNKALALAQRLTRNKF